MDLDKIRELIALAQEHDLVELEVREGEQTIRFRRNAEARSTAGSPPAVAAVAAVVAVGAEASPAHGIAPQLTGFVLRAPMAGTFFRASAPGERPFVEVGARVEVTTVIGIIESMKMMNPVAAGCAGTIGAILLANSERVQIDQPLLTII